LRAEGFSFSLGVLYGGLGISKLQFLIKKIKIKISSSKFFSILGHQTPDQDPGSGSAIIKNTGSGSALNQCGSATLAAITDFWRTGTFHHDGKIISHGWREWGLHAHPLSL
jgi:hypothetical protein